MPHGQEAEVADARPTQEVGAGATSFKADLQQSRIEWMGAKPTGQHHGFARISEGKLFIKEGKIAGGNFTIDMKTIEATDMADSSDNKDLSDHLKDEDFFKVARFPATRFEITAVTSLDTLVMNSDEVQPDEPLKEKSIEGANYKVTGNLSIMDSVKGISFPAKISMSGTRIIAEANFNINRTHWGITYKSDKSPGNKFIYHMINFDVKLVMAKE